MATQEDLDYNILIDPSLLIEPNSFDSIMDYTRRRAIMGEQFFVPNALVRLLSDKENRSAIQFYTKRKETIGLDSLKSGLQAFGIKQFIISENWPERLEDPHIEFYEGLLEETGSKIIADVIFEEWYFLQTKSWVISKIKKPFTYMNKAGAVTLEVGKKTLDLATKRTLHKDKNTILTNADRLRAAAKWIAAGGSSVAGLFEGVDGVLLSAAANYFILFDP